MLDNCEAPVPDRGVTVSHVESRLAGRTVTVHGEAPPPKARFSVVTPICDVSPVSISSAAGVTDIVEGCGAAGARALPSRLRRPGFQVHLSP